MLVMGLIGAVVCLLAAPLVQLFAGAGNGSCYFRDYKALLPATTHESDSSKQYED